MTSAGDRLTHGGSCREGGVQTKASRLSASGLFSDPEGSAQRNPLR